VAPLDTIKKRVKDLLTNRGELNVLGEKKGDALLDELGSDIIKGPREKKGTAQL